MLARFLHMNKRIQFLNDRKILFLITIIFYSVIFSNLSFADVPMQGSIRQVVASEGHTCSVSTDNKLYCWGINPLTPIVVLEDVASVSLGRLTKCAIKIDGKLYCWGDNSSGQVGNGSTTHQSTPVEVLDDVSSVSLGSNFNAETFTCAVKTDGKLYCWGINWYGQVGNGNSGFYAKQLTLIEVLEDVVSASLGDEHVCALKRNRTLYCWGRNDYGQVGNGSTIPSNSGIKTPVEVLEDVVSVSLGQYQTCAIKTNGKLYCWGRNNNGQAGNGSTSNQLTPIEVLEDVASVSLGQYHSCAIKTNGKLYCWGRNINGQVGNGSTTSYNSGILTPVEVLEDVASVGLGGDGNNGYTCAIKTNGKLYCWGWNSIGQIGNGSTNDQLTPVEVLEEVASEILGWYHTCAIKTDGKLYCWGSNYNGQVGNGTTENQSTPQEIFDGSGSVPIFTNDCSKHWNFANLNNPCETTNENICNKQGVYRCYGEGNNASIICAPQSCCEDESFSLIGNTCFSGGVGACNQSGEYACGGIYSNSLVSCNALQGNPSEEACNNIDDDCDGEIDEDFGIGENCETEVGVGHYECENENSVKCKIDNTFTPTPIKEIEVVTPITELPAPEAKKGERKNILFVNLPKVIHAAIRENVNNPHAKFKYLIHVRKLKRNGVKDKFYNLGKKVLTYHKKNKIKFKNMDKGIYSVRYKVIITKGNKEKATRWSERTLIEI